MAGRGWTEKPVFQALGVGLIALLVRLWWTSVVDTQPVTDFEWYLERAVGLAQGDGYSVGLVRTAYWPVGYPMFLSLVFRLLGSTLLVAKLTNVVLSAACASATCSLAWKTGAGKWTAVAAGLLMALSPPMVAYSGILASEPLYILLSLLACQAALAAARHSVAWGWAGFWSGFAAHVRPQAALVPLILAVSTHRFQNPKQRTALWKTAAVAMVSLTLVMVPWTVRNWRTFGSPVFVSTNGGDNLWIGSAPGATGRYITPPGRPAEPSVELENDRRTRAEAMGYIREDFGRYASLAGPKLAATFLSATDAPYWAFQTERGTLSVPGTGPERDAFLVFRQVNLVWTYSLILFAAIGTAVGLLSSLGRRLVALALPQVAYVALVSVVFFGNGRFGLPAQPFLVLLGCGAFASIREWSARQPASADPLVDS